jgi:membrane protein YdbS with pleckstrin-like domain
VVIWNEVMPNRLRGRLSGIEMISYMTGPLLGNARAGWVAAENSVAVSLWSGGIICVVAVIATAWVLPSFWRYRSDRNTAAAPMAEAT